MVSFIESKKDVRKAIETPLALLVNTMDPVLAVQWPNFALDQAALPVKEFLVVAHSFGDPTVLELGLTPRIQVMGTTNIFVRTAVGLGSDRNDTLAGIVAGAYPYGQALERNLVSVIIDKIGGGGYGVDGAWFLSTVAINWVFYWRDTDAGS